MVGFQQLSVNIAPLSETVLELVYRHQKVRGVGDLTFDVLSHFGIVRLHFMQTSGPLTFFRIFETAV